MGEIKITSSYNLHKCIIFITLLSGITANPKELQEITSKSRTVDEWLNSEDLFPGHIIPHSLHHSDALKMFNKLLEDIDIFSRAYERFRVQHNKDSEPDIAKIEMRKANFRNNLQFIFHHNLRSDLGHYRFNVGVNDFADMSDDEMTHFLGANDKIPLHPEMGEHGNGMHNGMMGNSHTFGSNSAQFPPNYDLRDENLMSPVKNQRNCGSCVFFSMGGLVESLHASKSGGDIINVSEQMMLNCATQENGYEYNGGCNGNIMESTLQFLQDHGVGHESHLPYKAKQGNCSDDFPVVAQLKDWRQVDPNPEAIKEVLVNLKTPVAVAYLVYQPFMFYRSGIYDFCPTPGGYTGGHAVLVAGYGKFFDVEYWIVKNSWSVRWGEKGYFRYMIGAPFCGLERWAFTASLA